MLALDEGDLDFGELTHIAVITAIAHNARLTRPPPMLSLSWLGNVLRGRNPPETPSSSPVCSQNWRYKVLAVVRGNLDFAELTHIAEMTAIARNAMLMLPPPLLSLRWLGTAHPPNRWPS